MIISKLTSITGGVNAKRIIKSFADEYGLVYFGSVSQHDDEHQIIRGMTVSHKHQDAHYCIGTYGNYDVTFVERSDTLLSKKNKRQHTWHIFQFDLHTKKDLPHIFIGLHTHSESYYLQLMTKYSHLRPLVLGALYRQIPSFEANYRVFGQPARHIDIEKLLSATVGEMYVKNFGSLAIEVKDGSLYVYSEKIQLTKTLLEAMIKNGTWLAGHIDSVSDSID
jgi:hypothetical protein